MGKRKGKRKGKLRGEAAEEQERNAKREFLARELQLTDVNARKQRLAWRYKMIRLNLPIVREELEAAWHTFDKAFDDRDYSISVLLDELRISSEQKRRADFAHAEEIDRLLEVYKQHLDGRGSHYEESIRQSLVSMEYQTHTIEDEEKEKDLLLRTLIFTTKLKHGDEAENMKTKNLSKLDGLKEENDNVLRTAEVILKRHLRNHSEELTSVLRDHEENTKDRRKDFQSLKEKDDIDQKTIAMNAIRIEKLYETLNALKMKIFEFKQLSDKEISDCRFERDYFRDAYFTIQKRLLSEQALDRQGLKCLTIEYNKTDEFLKQCVLVVEQMISALDLCSKYETYEDKLLLYPLSTAFEANCTHDSLPESKSNDTQQVFVDNYPLRKFLRVVSKVNTDVMNLKHSMRNLINESNKLKCSLKLYMNEVLRPNSESKQEKISTSPCVIDVKDVLRKH